MFNTPIELLNENVGSKIYMKRDDLIPFSFGGNKARKAEKFKKEIVKNKLEISQIKLYFTTDLRQNQETLENTLIEFKIDENTQKYKMYNVEAKILGI